MLSADDPLAFRPERVLVAGVSGSGKTTLAARLGAAWGLRDVEIDALFHGPNWTPRETFLDDVRAFAAEDRWITEWQYTSKGTDAILPPRAQLVLWLDYPYRVVRGRLIRRTLARGILRRELWNGNREKGPWNMFHRDPEQNILAWQANTLHKWTERMPQVLVDFPHLTIVRLRHPRETERWVRAQALADGVSTAPPKRRSRDR
ncbi:MULTISPECIES: AAA family ATPase [unclassified Microbacterium]|uniref:AAA family ATPase n=1 Tax=unclassified Microbacterium TaxID=2609290 RepID=UPI000EAA2A2C|nr:MULTISPECIES: AAA family ATPase [unclassified Microbacterium]MBT2486143.1 AAA family ATPase [Microbacterium sp. ISL-108]RKN68870.1 AAA family ATPase [Microbacterium sp. CGR2]